MGINKPAGNGRSKYLGARDNDGTMEFPLMQLDFGCHQHKLPLMTKSSSTKDVYTMSAKVPCTCQDFLKRGHYKGPCKHVEEKASQYGLVLDHARSSIQDKVLVYKDAMSTKAE